jgi:hypothetical protein
VLSFHSDAMSCGRNCGLICTDPFEERNER